MKHLRLQSLTPEHLSAAVALDQTCLGGLWTTYGYAREIDSPNSDLLILIPEGIQEGIKDALIGLGCLWAIVDEAHITLLAIDPFYQRQGLGQFLLIQLLHNAVARNLHTATLEVAASNQAALNLYKKFGFAPIGTRRKYYQKTGEDALILGYSGLQRSTFHEFLTDLCDQSLKHLQAKGWIIQVSNESD